MRLNDGDTAGVEPLRQPARQQRAAHFSSAGENDGTGEVHKWRSRRRSGHHDVPKNQMCKTISPSNPISSRMTARSAGNLNKTLFEKVSSHSTRMVVDRGEQFVALLCIKTRCLKLVGIEPDADTTSCTRNILGPSENVRSEMVPSEPIRHHEQFHEQPVVDSPAPQPANRLACCRVLYQHRERLCAGWTGGPVVECDQGLKDSGTICCGRLIRDDNDSRIIVRHGLLTPRLRYRTSPR